MVHGRDNNPLKYKLPPQEIIEYLFSLHAGVGFLPPDRAIRESVAELRIHEGAMVAATRAAVEGTLRDFEPSRLKKVPLAKVKSGPFQFFDNAKLWEAYEQHYEKESQHMADWLENLISRHFMPAYAKETERLKTIIVQPGSLS